MATHKVTFEPMHRVVEVEESKYPYGREGEPGSILDIALGHGIELEHACGGSGVCGTCRVEIEAGMENLSEATDDEMETCDLNPGSTIKSRLACQAVVHGDVTVRIA
jgi:2Fe-2S ferredoxin